MTAVCTVAGRSASRVSTSVFVSSDSVVRSSPAAASTRSGERRVERGLRLGDLCVEARCKLAARVCDLAVELRRHRRTAVRELRLQRRVPRGEPVVDPAVELGRERVAEPVEAIVKTGAGALDVEDVLELADLELDVPEADRVAVGSLEVLRDQLEARDAVAQPADVDVAETRAQVEHRLDSLVEVGDLGREPRHEAAQALDAAEAVLELPHPRPLLDVVRGRAVEPPLEILGLRRRAADVAGERRDARLQVDERDPGRDAAAVRGEPRLELGVERVDPDVADVMVVLRRELVLELVLERGLLEPLELEQPRDDVDQGVPLVGLDPHPPPLARERADLVDEASDPAGRCRGRHLRLRSVRRA